MIRKTTPHLFTVYIEYIDIQDQVFMEPVEEVTKVNPASHIGNEPDQSYGPIHDLL